MNKDLASPLFIQKIYSSGRYISIQLHGNGQGGYIYLGRGKGYEGIWFGKKPIPSQLRAKDQFLEYLRKHLSGGILLKVRCDSQDRIAVIEYQKFAQKNYFSLFWNSRNLYLAHEFYDPEMKTSKKWTSWEGPVESEIEIMERFDEIGRKDLSNTVHKKVIKKNIEELLQDEAEELQMTPLLRKKDKKNKIKLEKIKNDLENITEAIRLQKKIIDLDPSELENVKKLEVGKLTQKFPAGLNPYQKKDYIFQWIKRIKKVKELQEKRFSELEKEMNVEIKSIPEIKIIQPIWKTSKIKKKEKEVVKNYKIVPMGDYKIGYGVDAKGNDQLRKEWAKDQDMWVHLEGRKSTHAIIKTHNPSLDLALIREAAKIIAKLSGITEGEIDVIYTQVKNLKGVAGNPGMVNYKKEKKLRLILG